MLLYVFCALLLIFIGSYFWTTQRKLESNLLSKPETAIRNDSQIAGVDPGYRLYLETQTAVSNKRYEQGARILLTTSTRKNTGFLVGTLLAFMGCIIVVRRVRRMPITADFAATEKAKLKVITSSPGVFITLLGTIIIMSTILRYDSFDVNDAFIAPPGQMGRASNGNDPAPQIDPAQQKQIIDSLNANNSMGEKK